MAIHSYVKINRKKNTISMLPHLIMGVELQYNC